VRKQDKRQPPKGAILLIGGAEDRSGDRRILAELRRRTGAGELVVCTAGSSVPEQQFDAYLEAFQHLGLRKLAHAKIPTREAADDANLAATVAGAKAFFFTGGDQVQITSKVAGSRLHEAILALYAGGGTLAGTSAGASALGDTMPVSTIEDEHRVAAAWKLLPGLGLIANVIVDQHFAQRGRMGRLIAGVAENPRVLGIGIDENTALVWQRGWFDVMGAGAVYVVDGAGVTASNVADGPAHSAISAFDLRLHVLSAGDGFDVPARRPAPRR
jgi:cyanophycinase